MKKILLVILFAFITFPVCNPSSAENYMSLPERLPSQINSTIFSTEGTRPLLNLERTNYTNQALMDLQEKRNKNNTDINTKQSTNENEEQNIEQKGLKKLFKGFVVEW